ncbi:MAG: tyrosine-protein kinase family protein [Vulcanimicrobiaceae bacterium]
MMKQLADQYQALRVTLESAIQNPSVIVVTSALEGDGSDEVACNLARAFAEGSYRTAIVDAARDVTTLATHLGVNIRPTDSFESIASSGVNGTITNLKAIAISSKCMPRVTTRHSIQALIADLKKNYDVVVIQTGPIPTDAAALQLSKVADGVLLSFRLGRRPARADKETQAMLERVSANVLGVVAIAKESERRAEPVETPTTIHGTIPKIETAISALDKTKEPVAAGN